MHKKGIFINERDFKILTGLNNKELGLALRSLINAYASGCLSISVYACIQSLSTEGRSALLLPFVENVYLGYLPKGD